MEGVVISLELTIEVLKSLDDESLNLAALFERVARGESESTDGSSGTASSGKDVFAGGVNLGLGDVSGVHVSGVHGVRRVSTVAS